MASNYAELTPIKPKPPFRVGLIGVTGYGYDHFKCLTDLAEQGRVEWGAVTIINPEDAKEQIETFESLGVPYSLIIDRCLSWKGEISIGFVSPLG